MVDLHVRLSGLCVVLSCVALKEKLLCVCIVQTGRVLRGQDALLP